MSCSHLIEGYTNSKYLYNGVSRLRQSFVCGKCASCIRKQRTDWRVRTYYEAMNCLKDSRHFVLFDTLTYCDDAIKRYSDIFPEMEIPRLLDSFCFSRADVQKFFKRLRINLRRSGYSFDDKDLRYIVASEYGSSEETNGFKNTHRPHYHILFFVSFDIHPVEFSRHVSRAWPLGKTDGVRPSENCFDCPLNKYCRGRCIYQSGEYVMRERVVNNDSPDNCIRCVNYVTKYISKDMYFVPELQFRVDMLWKYLHPDYKSDLLLYRQYRRFCSQVLPFHLQSKFFGLSLLDDADEKEYIIKYNQVHLPTSNRSVVNSVAVPRYYQRKLYYDYKKVDGRIKWFLTDFGLDVKVSQLDSKISAFSREYRAFDNSVTKEVADSLAQYKLVYCGTMAKTSDLQWLDYHDYYRKSLQPHDEETERPLYYNLNTKRDKLSVGAFLSTRYVVTPDGEMKYKGRQLHKEFKPYSDFVVVNAADCSYWKRVPWYSFDRMLNNYDRWRKRISEVKDDEEYSNEVHVDYYKRLGMLRP